MSLKQKLFGAVMSLAVLGIAILPTEWFRTPPHCPLCGKWATKMLIDRSHKSVFARCSRCEQEWMEFTDYDEPCQWWSLTTDVSTDSPQSTHLEPGTQLSQKSQGR